MGLLSALVLAGALVTHPSQTTSDRPIVDCERLRPYVATDYRCRVVMGYDEGISQLRRYAEAGRPELAFIYVPATSEWFEAGLESDERKVALDVDFLKEMILTHDLIVRIHTHPVTRKGLDRSFQANEDAVPSAGDLQNMIFATALMHEHDPEGRVQNEVISSYGVVRYDATDDGRQAFRDLWSYAVPLAADAAGRNKGATTIDEMINNLDDAFACVSLTPFVGAQAISGAAIARGATSPTNTVSQRSRHE